MGFLAHMGGLDEALVFLAPIAAFGLGGYFLVYRPLREDNENVNAAEHDGELRE